MRAVEVINRERLHIKKMQEGSPADQKLASALTAAIETYNKHAYALPKEGKGLAQYLSDKLTPSRELPVIQLPQPMTVTYHYPPQGSSDIVGSTSKYAMSVINPVTLALSKQSAELFQMKVLALLERYGIASNPEARALVKQSPIQTSIKSDDASTCMLTQTLSLFPGQTVVVMGTSALDPKTQTISRLFPETFSVSLELTQTAFPHASQRTGWALANQLLPECPQRMDLLHESAELFQRKKQTMGDLLPHGMLIGKAKQLLKLKKKVFAAHQTEFITLHQKLARTLLKAAPAPWILPKAETAVDDFYENLKQHPFAFDRLAEANQSICENFIAKPQQVLLDAILKGKHGELGSPHPVARYGAAKAILALEFKENQDKLAGQQGQDPIQSAYIVYMGNVLGLAAQPIILQYLSEDLIFIPPSLSLFEQCVQAAAYRHASDFMQELAIPLEDEAANLASVYQWLRREIEADMAIFQGKDKLSLPAELARYFEQRYTGG